MEAGITRIHWLTAEDLEKLQHTHHEYFSSKSKIDLVPDSPEAFEIRVLGHRHKPQFYMREEGSIDQLFAEVINIKAIHLQLGMNESTVRALRKKLNDGVLGVSVEKKREILKAAGYKMVQEERWGR